MRPARAPTTGRGILKPATADLRRNCPRRPRHQGRRRGVRYPTAAAAAKAVADIIEHDADSQVRANLITITSTPSVDRARALRGSDAIGPPAESARCAAWRTNTDHTQTAIAPQHIDAIWPRVSFRGSRQ